MWFDVTAHPFPLFSLSFFSTAVPRTQPGSPLCNPRCPPWEHSASRVDDGEFSHRPFFSPVRPMLSTATRNLTWRVGQDCHLSIIDQACRARAWDE